MGSEINFNRTYERNINHNYMILSKGNYFGVKNEEHDFKTRMLLENRIHGLLPVSFRQINGEDRYYYEINSLQSFDRLYDKKEMTYEELRSVLMGCADLFERLEQYLLDGSLIIIRSEYIYINIETMEPYFVCYPEYSGNVRLDFAEFIDEILTKIDHTDQNAVMLGYQIYRYTRNPNFVVSEIKTMLEHTIVNAAKEIYRDKAVREFADTAGNASIDNNCSIQDYTEGINRFGDNNKIKEIKTDSTSADKANINNYDEGINNSSFPDVYNDYEEAEDDEYIKEMSRGNSGNIIGCVFSVFIVISALFIILGARILNIFSLDSKYEMYLYCAIAMSVVSEVIFVRSYIRNKKIQAESEHTENEYKENEYMENGYKENRYMENQYMENKYTQNKYTENNFAAKPDYGNKYGFNNGINHEKGQDVLNLGNMALSSRLYKNYGQCSETCYLGDEVVEERVLRGRIDGKEVNISLNKLPMTIGKLANFADYVINDNAVSKVHARFEEKDGKIYVSDLNSTNGTVRNGEPLAINDSVRLEPGDRLRFGRTFFTYC